MKVDSNTRIQQTIVKLKFVELIFFFFFNKQDVSILFKYKYEPFQYYFSLVLRASKNEQDITKTIKFNKTSKKISSFCKNTSIFFYQKIYLNKVNIL